MTNKKKIVILSGAGISQESGIQTFRDSNGLWEQHKIEDVCTADAWLKNPTLVNNFYNVRRIDAMNAQPNRAHIALAEAEEIFDVQIITTNVDDLHERAGSTNILHLHGNLLQARTSRTSVGYLADYLVEPFLVPVGREGIAPMQQAADGELLRPHIVFFQEDVPNMSNAEDIIREADALIVVGTSMQVYPAAGLVWLVKDNTPVFYVDPSTDPDAGLSFPCRFFNSTATVGIPAVLEQLKATFNSQTSD